jgi:ribosomal protein S27AE
MVRKEEGDLMDNTNCSKCGKKIVNASYPNEPMTCGDCIMRWF